MNIHSPENILNNIFGSVSVVVELPDDAARLVHFAREAKIEHFRNHEGVGLVAHFEYVAAVNYAQSRMRR